jgi:hypothetical protein
VVSSDEDSNADDEGEEDEEEEDEEEDEGDVSQGEDDDERPSSSPPRRTVAQAPKSAPAAPQIVADDSVTGAFPALPRRRTPRPTMALTEPESDDDIVVLPGPPASSKTAIEGNIIPQTSKPRLHTLKHVSQNDDDSSETLPESDDDAPPPPPKKKVQFAPVDDDESANEPESDDEAPRPSVSLSAAAQDARSLVAAAQDATEPYVLDKRTDTRVPPSLNWYLREYQREGVRFLFERYRAGRGAVLGDDMGLGKTIQVRVHARCVPSPVSRLVAPTRPLLVASRACLTGARRQVIAFLSALMHKTGTPADIDRRRNYVEKLQDRPEWRTERRVPPPDERWPTALIVVPRSVVGVWAREFPKV